MSFSSSTLCNVKLLHLRSWLISYDPFECSRVYGLFFPLSIDHEYITLPARLKHYLVTCEYIIYLVGIYPSRPFDLRRKAGTGLVILATRPEGSH